MDDLISRSALFNIVEPRLDYLRDENGPYDHYTDGYEECYDRIDEAPTVDAVEVIRCRECKHYGWEQKPCHGRIQRFCRLHKGLVCVTKDSFCSYGERKDNG